MLAGLQVKNLPALARGLDETFEHGALAAAQLVDQQNVTPLGGRAELLETRRQGRRREVEIPFPRVRKRFFFEVETPHMQIASAGFPGS